MLVCGTRGDARGDAQGKSPHCCSGRMSGHRTGRKAGASHWCPVYPGLRARRQVCSTDWPICWQSECGYQWRRCPFQGTLAAAYLKMRSVLFLEQLLMLSSFQRAAPPLPPAGPRGSISYVQHCRELPRLSLSQRWPWDGHHECEAGEVFTKTQLT